MALAKSFLDSSPYDLPFEVQLNDHMKMSRFHQSYDWDNYVHNLILAMGLTMQYTYLYNISETWYKEIPGIGYKFIFYGKGTPIKVRTIFRTFKGAPRALSKNEFENFFTSSGGDRNSTWCLKEYLIKDKKIIEMKSCNSWISKYPAEKGEEIGFMKQTCSSELNKFFKDTNNVRNFIRKTVKVYDFISQYFEYYRNTTVKYLNNECAFHHGIQIAFESFTNYAPQAIHVLKDSMEGIFLRYENETVTNVHKLPAIFSVNMSMSLEEEKLHLKHLSTRSGFYGQSLLMWSHARSGSGGIFHMVANTYSNVDWDEVGDMHNWLSNELNRIWPVDIAVDEDDVFRNVFFLSRYIAGIMCSIVESNYQHKVTNFGNYYSNQFLFGKGTGNETILEVNEYVILKDKVDRVNENRKNMCAVIVNQYIDNNNVLRRDIYFLPPSSVDNHEVLEDFLDFTATLDWASIIEFVDDELFDERVCKAVTECFNKMEKFLGSRQEVKAFLRGTFHYYETIHCGGDKIQETLGTFNNEKDFSELLTFNFLKDNEEPLQLIDSLAQIHRIVNIFYEKPYRVYVNYGSTLNIDFDAITFTP